jgi:hypothetical protein
MRDPSRGVGSDPIFQPSRTLSPTTSWSAGARRDAASAATDLDPYGLMAGIVSGNTGFRPKASFATGSLGVERNETRIDGRLGPLARPISAVVTPSSAVGSSWRDATRGHRPARRRPATLASS